MTDVIYWQPMDCGILDYLHRLPAWDDLMSETYAKSNDLRVPEAAPRRYIYRSAETSRYGAHPMRRRTDFPQEHTEAAAVTWLPPTLLEYRVCLRLN